ncbi:hypothetical protein ABZZ20_36585, partial [Streptomyces sp. NPDC006430]|uniref:hypothetical protein n=1 Tax=Streptomyces sp. NPDC006430 TaxID=3154299 RepID=UPI0033BC73B1
MADLLGVGVEEVEGYRVGRRPSEAVGERIDAVWRLLRAGRTGLTSADVDDAVNAGRSRSGPAAGGAEVSGQVGGMFEVAPAVDYRAGGTDLDPELGMGEGVEGLNAEDWAGVLEALESDSASAPGMGLGAPDSASESGMEPGAPGEGIQDLDPDALRFLSEALGFGGRGAGSADADSVYSTGEGGGGLSGDEVMADPVEFAGNEGMDAVAGQEEEFTPEEMAALMREFTSDVEAAREAKRRRLNDGRSVGEAAAAKLLLQVKLERVRDGLVPADGEDRVALLAEVLKIHVDRVRRMLSGALNPIGMPGQDIERIDAAFLLLNDAVALTAEAVDERVSARWTPLQKTMVYLMEEASRPGRTAMGVRLSDLLGVTPGPVYGYRLAKSMPNKAVGDRINAVKRLFKDGKVGLTPKQVKDEVIRYREEEEEGLDFAGKLAYVREKLGGENTALVSAITASAARVRVSTSAVSLYFGSKPGATPSNPPLDLVERVDELYVLYRDLDAVAETAGLPASGTINPPRLQALHLKASLGEEELDRLLDARPGEVSYILRGGMQRRVKVVERINAAYGLLMKGAAVTAEAVDERVRAGWTPLQNTMVYLLEGVHEELSTLADLLEVRDSSVRSIRMGVQKPNKSTGDRIRALERLLKRGGPRPTRANVDDEVAAMPAYDLTARARFLCQVVGSTESAAWELNAGREVGEPTLSTRQLGNYRLGRVPHPSMEITERIDRACHEFWGLGFRPADAELAGVLRGEVAAAVAAGSAVGSVGGGDGTLARLVGRGRLAGERTQVGYAWRWFRDGAGREVVRLT